MPKRAPAPPPRKVPKRATPPGDVPSVLPNASIDDHLEIITRAVFQAGLSWAIIASRWPAFVDGFDRFDVRRVAAYGDADIDRLMSTEAIVHSAKKIAGTIENARVLIGLERDFGNVPAYVATFPSYADLFADAHRRFAYMGDLSCYYWLFRTGQPVPPFEDWIAGQKTDHPRMREMVMLGRSLDVSRERPGY